MLRNLFLLIVVLCVSNLVYSQTNPVDFSISIEEGKKVFRKGEPVRVVLSFVINQPNYKIRMNGGDKVNILPKEGIFDWKEQQNRGQFDRDHVFGFLTEYKNPTNITIYLNDFVRFDKAGKYSVNISTTRVYFSQHNDKKRFGDKKQQPALTSNAVDFEIREMTQAEEKEEILRISKLIELEKDYWKKAKLGEELSFLTGEAATIEKVRLFLNPSIQNPNFYHYINKGLYLSAHKDLAVKLLEDAFNDLNHEVQIDLIFMILELKRTAKSVNNAAIDNRDGKATPEQRFQQFEEAKQIYIQKLFETLSARKGKSRATGAFTVFTNLPRNDTSSAAFNLSKSIILQQFEELHPFSQDLLLSAHWERLKSTEILSSLEKIVIKNNDSAFGILRGNALKRLIELAPEKAKIYVIAEIKKSSSYISPEILSLIKEEYLQEVDNDLLQQIREAANKSNSSLQLMFKNHLAARFATKKIYRELMRIYTNYGHTWREDERNALLAYFLKHNEREAIPMAGIVLNKWFEKDGFHIFFNLTRFAYSEGLEKILRKRLESDDSRISQTAAHFLSIYGGKGNYKLLKLRYLRWLKQWQPRKDEFDKENAGDEIKLQKGFQTNLVYALKNAKSWKLTPKELKELKQTCLSEDCLRYFPKN